MSSHRAVSPQVYRRRRAVVFGGLGVVLTALVYLPMTLLAPLPAAAITVETPADVVVEAPPLAFPGYGASAIGAVGSTGVLGQSGTTDAVPMASITKVITALVVLDAFPLAPGEAGPDITMTSTDVSYYGEYLALNGTVSNVRSGMVFTERELLELTLVKSANNYTKSLMMWAFGSQDAYLAATQSWLTAHGLDGVVVQEPTGIDRSNVAPAALLVELGRLALAHPTLAEIVAKQEVEVANLGALPNTNKLLGLSGVDGIKTGTLDDFGANLLFSGDYTVGDSTVTLVGVVLGGPDHPTINADILTLLSSAVANFTEVEVTPDAAELARFSSIWGESVAGVASERVTMLLWGSTSVETQVVTDEVVTGRAGDDVGDIVFRAGEQTITIDLELAADLDDPGAWWRLTNPAALF